MEVLGGVVATGDGSQGDDGSDAAVSESGADGDQGGGDITVGQEDVCDADESGSEGTDDGGDGSEGVSMNISTGLTATYCFSFF